jgi:hypothetical protein
MPLSLAASTATAADVGWKASAGPNQAEAATWACSAVISSAEAVSYGAISSAQILGPS